MFNDRTIDLSKQLPGLILVASSGILSVFLYSSADVIRDFLVNVLRFAGRRQVRCASSDRIAAHGTEVLVSVTSAIHTHRQMRPEIGTMLSIAFPLFFFQ